MDSRLRQLLDSSRSDLEISKELRAIIKEYFTTLDELFAKTQGKDFLVRHTRYIDSIIKTIYKIAVRKLFGIYSPLSNAIPLTLTALGSYGREQLAPYSDIDLMLVYEEIEGYNTRLLIEKILHIAWDAGLKLGHRVHEISELQSVAKEDITIKTALLESRFIIGSKYLWFEIQNELTQIRHTDQKEYVLAKLEEAKQRRKKYRLNMQPFLKEGVGGLRDSNLLFWIANSLYGVRSTRDLSGTLFSDEEYKEYRIALEWLFRLRAALHLVAGKKEDRLLMQYIPDLVSKLQIKGTTPQKRQQILMSKTFQAMHTIDTFSQTFTKKMVRPLLYESTNIPLFKRARITAGFYECEDHLFSRFVPKERHITNLLQTLNLTEFTHYDPSVLYVAKQTKSPKKTSKNLLQQIKKLFYKKHLYAPLRLLHQANLLGMIVPPLKKVLHMPQFDGYHQYPVDIHSLECVRALEHIQEPFIQELFDSLSPEEQAMLRLVVLLHDSGKGRRQRHHEVGAKLLRFYAQKIGFAPELIEIGATLIKYHTAMTEIAYNQDIHSQKVIYAFTAPLGRKKILDMLYILTYTDIKGVGKDIYTSYHANLLRELYNQALEALQNREILDEVTKRLRKERALIRHLDFQALPKILQKKILSIDSNLFFIKHRPEEIIQIAKRAYETKDFSYQIEEDDYLTIEIYRRKPLNLGYLLGRLSYLDIASMEVFKLFDQIKYFRIEFIGKEADRGYIEQVIHDSFDMDKQIRLKKPIIELQNITIDCDHSKTYAFMGVEAKNQKGLLAYLAKIFDDFGIDIATARINTVKGRAKDMFLIEKNGKFCSKKEQILQKLTGA